jgi:phosphate transport system protein
MSAVWEMEIPFNSRQNLDQEMRALEQDLLEMGSRAEFMVAQSIDSLSRLDTALAYEVIRSDDEIDERDLDIENRCLKVLALQQPMASDLRVIGTMMKFIVDIERVGDLAVDIAKITLKVDKELGETGIIDLPRMGHVARTMFRDSLESFVRRDLNLVSLVVAKDDEADDLYRVLRGQVHEWMRTHPEDVVSASWLLLAIHHLERIADHACNIAERVEFMVTGSTARMTGGRGNKD